MYSVEPRSQPLVQIRGGWSGMQCAQDGQPHSGAPDGKVRFPERASDGPGDASGGVGGTRRPAHRPSTTWDGSITGETYGRNSRVAGWQRANPSMLTVCTTSRKSTSGLSSHSMSTIAAPLAPTARRAVNDDGPRAPSPDEPVLLGQKSRSEPSF